MNPIGKLMLFVLLVTLVISAAEALSANEKLKKCCAKSEVAEMTDDCRPYCSFDTMDPYKLSGSQIEAQLWKIYEKKACAMDDIDQVAWCINKEKDHRECCASKGVSGLCLDFCAPITDLWLQLVDNKYSPCIKALKPIFSCYKEFIGSAEYDNDADDSTSSSSSDEISDISE